MRETFSAIRDSAWTAANVDTCRVAVTGLSRAGKTAMMVSLISNLLAMGRGTSEGSWNSLPALTAHLSAGAAQSRLLSVDIEPAGAQRIPRFEYEEYRHHLASGTAPAWPPVTDRPAQITLRLTLSAKSTLGGLREGFLGPRRVRLELLDYPGEWLADLPMLDLGYDAWSDQVLAELRSPPRLEYAGPFLDFLSVLRPDAPDSDEVAAMGQRLYREVLRRCRDERGLRWLQPGRFLMPGPWGEVPLLNFFPCDRSSAIHVGSLRAQMRDRFEAYKDEVRETFFEPYFSRFDRQVVLVDVLAALHAGRSAFEDVRRSLHQIGDSYAKLLEGSWFGARRIEAVAFAATKSDHVDDIQRPHLESLLRRMVERDGASGSNPTRRTFHAISSIRCTQDGSFTDADGRTHRVVRGVAIDSDVARPFSPGTVPAQDVPEHFWKDAYFVMPQLRPPALRDGAAYPIEHLNLDGLLVALLGDVL